MNKIYIPTSSAEQWAQFLAEPVNHWRKGYSARTLAYSWQEANGFPIEVGSVLSSAFPAVELLLALPEHQVPLPGGSRPSQNDIWVLARSQGQLDDPISNGPICCGVLSLGYRVFLPS